MRLLATALLLPLAACTVTSEPNTPSDRVCKDGGLNAFVGQQATSDLGSQMLAASGAKALRWAPKNSAVTMDFRPDRLTVKLTGDNRVEAARCG